MGIHTSPGLRLASLTASLAWRHRVALTLLCAALLGTACLTVKLGSAHAAPAGSDAPGPAVSRQGEKLVVPANSPLRTRLVVAAVSNVSAPHLLSLPATVEADPAHTVNILSPVTGRVTDLKVKLGDTVKRGQILAIISAPDLDQAYADADKARDALDLARKALDRARSVHDAGANAAKDFEQANSTYIQAQAESQRADARLATLGAGTGRESKVRALSITAPISGTITALNSSTGSYLNDPTAPLMTIANLDNVWVTANVPEDLLSAVAKGQNAEVALSAFPGQTWKGQISFVSALLEPDTHRNKTRIAFANPDGKLKPNMYATVSIAVPQPAGLSIPTSALLMNNDAVSVFVETAPWTFERRTVDTGREDNDSVRIVAGLAAGERVVVRGGVLLND